MPRNAGRGWRRHGPRLGLAGALAVLTGALAATASGGDGGGEPLGLAASGAPVHVERVQAGAADAPTVVLLGGLAGEDPSSATVREAADAWRDRAPDERPFHLLAVAVANPDAEPLVFPPTGTAYNDNTVSHLLWRWIGLGSVDRVTVVGDGDHGLVDALAGQDVAGVAPVPAQRLAAGADPLETLAAAPIGPSPATLRLRERRDRTAEQVARALADEYAQGFDPPTYLTGMGLIGHLRLGRRAHVERLVDPWVIGGRDGLDPENWRFGGSLHISGYLAVAELARETGDEAQIEQVRRAASFAFDDDGEPLEAMPFHGQMSDSIFMGAPILAAAGALTGEDRYFDMAVRHLEFMDELVRRDDDLYRHSPQSDAAWGRGNGFAALGYALVLSDLPADHPARERLVDRHVRHMEALRALQHDSGAWRQVLDQPGSYRETSATAIFGFAMQRGVREGWLSADRFAPVIDAAWAALLTRTSATGGFIDVCESTMAQDSLQAYLTRAALEGRDERTGGMALLFATERLLATGEAAAPR